MSDYCILVDQTTNFCGNWFKIGRVITITWFGSQNSSMWQSKRETTSC